jgi:hypothetical protein
VTRRRLQREGEPEAEREASPPAAPHPQASLLELQRRAGNAAVARVLAREPATDSPLLPRGPAFQVPGVMGGVNPLLVPRTQLAPDVERAVDAFLRMQAPGIRISVQAGRISMPEVVDRVRRSVPEAANAPLEGIRSRVIDVVGVVPETQGKPDLGTHKAAQEAKISNLFPTPPTSVTFGSSKTNVTIGIGDAAIKLGKLTVKADKEGGSVQHKDGDLKVGVSGKWDGSEFGLKTDVGGIKFESKIKRKGDADWGWTGGIVIPINGEEVDELPEIGAAVSGAHAAITESLGHIHGGGSPTDSFVTDRMGKIKPAIGAIGDVAGRKGKSGATLRLTGSADSGGWTAGVSLVIQF